jgi:hypothetical protein
VAAKREVRKSALTKIAHTKKELLPENKRQAKREKLPPENKRQAKESVHQVIDNEADTVNICLM